MWYQLTVIEGVLSSVSSFVLSWLLRFWLVLVVYSVVSAMFGWCKLRKLYVEVLRMLYRLYGVRLKQIKEKSVKITGCDTGVALHNMIRARSFRTFKREFQLEDVCDFIHDAVEVIVEDEVTKCFSTKDVEEWNLLNRTRTSNANLGLRLELLLCLSTLFRFTIFILVRLPIGIASILWLVFTMILFVILSFFFKEAGWKREFERYCTKVCSRLIAASFTAVINFHHEENRAQLGSVCVANHTTPIDIVMLASDNCFTLVGQRHGGFTGMIQLACSLAQKHIWFERKIASDRQMVAKRLKEHISNPRNNPILIFPEGTCINNTGVFMFKKGCFELGATIYPAVIKYRREFSDPFWNSQEQNMLTYLAMLMTSWAIVCDVHYLPPARIGEKETAIEFAQRVKADICHRGGLVDLPWDGMIKRPGHEGYLRKLVEEERLAYLAQLKIGDDFLAADENEKESDSNSDEDQGLRLSMSIEDKDV